MQQAECNGLQYTQLELKWIAPETDVFVHFKATGSRGVYYQNDDRRFKKDENSQNVQKETLRIYEINYKKSYE